MNKLVTIAILLSACTRNAEPNKAEIIVLSQAADAKCDTAVTAKRKIAVVVCEVNKQDVVAVYSTEYPFQAFGIKSTAKLKEEEKAKAKAAAEAAAPAAPAAPVPAPGAKK